MSSNNESTEKFDVSQYRKFLDELNSRAGRLWETVLCQVPDSNTTALVREHMIIRESLSEIEILQKTFSRTPEFDSTNSERREAALGDFLQWADAIGISHSSVEIIYDENLDGFGLITTEYASAGSDLLRVPRNAIFSLDQARRSSFLK